VDQPFTAAAELARVLRPGGTLYIDLPFLQPEHGYPHHYFNATHQGLRRLFEDSLAIESVTVPDMSHPAFALRWILDVWASGLPAAEREAFLGQRVRDLLRGPPEAIAAQPFGALLPEATRFEIASGCLLKARRPDDAAPRVDAHPPRA
jgi:SAM-dependent methyltransferase